MINAQIVPSIEKEIERIEKQSNVEALLINKKAYVKMNLTREETLQIIDDLKQQEKNAIIEIEQTHKDMKYELEEAENLRLRAETRANEIIRLAYEEANRLRQIGKKNIESTKKAVISLKELSKNASNEEKVLLRTAKMIERTLTKHEDRVERAAKLLEEQAVEKASREIEEAQNRKDRKVRLVVQDCMKRIQRAENAKVLANIWIKKTVNRSSRKMNKQEKIMNKNIEHSAKRAYVIKLILLFAKEQIDKALQYGIKGKYKKFLNDKVHNISMNIYY